MVNTPEQEHYWCRGWKGSQLERERLLELILERDVSQWDGEALHKLLRCFQANGLPRFDERILAMAEHPDRDYGVAELLRRKLFAN